MGIFSLARKLVSSTDEQLDVPYVPSRDENVVTMIRLADIMPGQRAADLGAGDGRIVIAMARAGAVVDGYELNSSRVDLARKNIMKAGFRDQATIYHLSFWDANLHDRDIIMLYGITHIMERLKKKLEDELQPGAKVISNTFPFPGWQPDKAEDDVYLYKR